MCNYFLLNTLAFRLVHWELEVFSSLKTEFRNSANQTFPLWKETILLSFIIVILIEKL